MEHGNSALISHLLLTFNISEPNTTNRTKDKNNNPEF